MEQELFDVIGNQAYICTVMQTKWHAFLVLAFCVYACRRFGFQTSRVLCESFLQESRSMQEVAGQHFILFVRGLLKSKPGQSDLFGIPNRVLSISIIQFSSQHQYV